MLSEIEYKKLFWHSRRGMLELDLLLVPFVDKCVAKLSAEDQVLYQQMLREEDQDLFKWLLLREPAPTEDLRRIIGIIRMNTEKNAEQSMEDAPV